MQNTRHLVYRYTDVKAVTSSIITEKKQEVNVHLTVFTGKF